jgi:DNA-binding transcriptional ArsR family regulator
MNFGTMTRPLALALLIALALGNIMPLLGQPGPVLHVRAAPSQSEIEANNDMGLAQTVSAGQFFKGAVDTRSDPEDWYKIFVKKGLALNATINIDDTKVLNADLEIYYYNLGGNLDRKWSITDYKFEAISILSVADQFYFMRVFASSGTGTYTFDTDITDPVTLYSGQTQGKALHNDSYDVLDYYKIWLNNRGTTADRLDAWLNKTPYAQSSYVWITLEAQHLYDWSVGIRTYDISWGDPGQDEHVRAVASESGWYYLRVYCYNGTGAYNLTVTVSSVTTDNNDRLSDAVLIYGPGSVSKGALQQALDHRDVYGIYLEQGEALSTDLELSFFYTNPTIFATTILQPDGVPVGEWTNYRDSGLQTAIQANLDHAAQTGRYIVMVEAKVAVNQSHIADLTDLDGQGNYTLIVTPSGHNSPPYALLPPTKIMLTEDTPSDADLSGLFWDDNIPQGDRLSYSVLGITITEGPNIEDALTVNLDGAKGPLAHLVLAANWSGSGAITVLVHDLFGETASASVPFLVWPVNDHPKARSQVLEFTLNENTEKAAVNLNSVFYDPDLPYGDELTFKVQGNGSFSAWIDGKGQLIIGPVIGFGQNEVFNVTATDLLGAKDTVQVIVSVADVEHSPVALSSTEHVTMNEDGSARLYLYTIFSDPDPQDARLSFQWAGNVHVGILLDDQGIMTFTPDPDWWGTDYVTLLASDHSGKIAKVDLIVKVDPIPDAPVIVSSIPSANGASPILSNGTGIILITVNVTDKDPEDAARTIYLWDVDGNVLLAPTDRPFLALDTSTLKNGGHNLTLIVKDGYGLSASASWKVEVSRPKPVPVIVKPTPTQTTTTGAVAVGLWAIVFAIVAEPSRFAIIKYLWVPLYTKIRKEEVLDQFVRGRIYGFIEHNPGVTYSQIKRKIGVGNGTLTHHLSMLEKQNYIKADRDGLYKRFYPRDYHIDEDAVELTTLQRDIFFLAKTEPGISQKDLSDRLSVSERVMSYHIHLLQEARLIRVERTGRKHALFVLET